MCALCFLIVDTIQEAHKNVGRDSLTNGSQGEGSLSDHQKKKAKIEGKRPRKRTRLVEIDDEDSEGWLKMS